MAEKPTTCRIGIFNNDYSEPEMKLSDNDFPRSDIEGLINKTHIITPNWKPFNQKRCRDIEAYEDYLCEQTYDDGSTDYRICFFSGSRWHHADAPKEEIKPAITKYMPIPE